MDDSRILDLYWARHESAIYETEQKYGSYCSAISINILHNNEDAQECVNDAFLKAWELIPPARPELFRAFLGKITRNLSLDKYKQSRTQKRGGGEMALLLSELEDCIPSSGGVETEYESKLTAQSINACLLSMDPEARTIFVRRYWYADSIREVAARFDMSESKVKSMLFRARKKLKTHLEKEGITI